MRAAIKKKKKKLGTHVLEYANRYSGRLESCKACLKISTSMCDP
jgi:hypothetical protein